MKKTILGFAMLVSMFSFSAQANDRIEAPIYTCALSFEAKGGGLQIVVGSFKLKGEGAIHCVDVEGNTEEIPVKVTMGGPLVAPNIGFGVFNVRGLATGIGLSTGPEALLGKYYMVGGRVAWIVGAGANLAVHGGAEALTLNLALSLESGAGLQVGVNRLKIEPLQ